MQSSLLFYYTVSTSILLFYKVLSLIVDLIYIYSVFP